MKLHKIIENTLTEYLNTLPVKETTMAIIGSRSFNNYSYAKKEILNIIQNNNLSVTKIISGGANGADKIAEKFAKNFNIPIEVITPDWSKGKQAGIIIKYK